MPLFPYRKAAARRKARRQAVMYMKYMVEKEKRGKRGVLPAKTSTFPKN